MKNTIKYISLVILNCLLSYFTSIDKTALVGSAFALIIVWIVFGYDLVKDKE